MIIVLIALKFTGTIDNVEQKYQILMMIIYNNLIQILNKKGVLKQYMEINAKNTILKILKN